MRAVPVETLIDDRVVLRLWLSDLDAVKLVVGLLVTATTVLMVRAVSTPPSRTT